MIKRNVRCGLHRSHQRGTALVIALILLTIITLLSVSAMHTTNMDTRIAVNHRFKELSFQAAESALAKATVPEPDPAVLLPNSVAGASRDNNGYFDSDDENAAQEPRLSADLTMRYVCQVAQGQSITESDCSEGVLVSGFPPDSGFVAYMAVATGFVGQSGTRTTNRSQVVLLTE